MEYPSLGTPPAGSIRFNTDSSKLEIYNGEAWWNIDTTSPQEQTGGGRGLYGGGQNPSYTDTVEYITISTTGDSQDFGDLSSSRTEQNSGWASRTRGILVGGYQHPTGRMNIIDYFTIASTGNATDFGDMTVGRGRAASASSNTRGCSAGGYVAPTLSNVIDYVTISQTGNSVDFGDLSTAMQQSALGLVGDGIRGVIMCLGETPSKVNTMDYIQIATTGNASDFGDSTVTTSNAMQGSNAVRGILMGGYDSSAQDTIEYITIASLGNAIDFGNLTAADSHGAGVSNSTRVVSMGGQSPYSMDYVEIMTTGNAMDFGDLSTLRGEGGSCSNSHGGTAVGT